MFASVANNIQTALGADHVAGSGTIQIATGYGATLAAAIAAAGFPAISSTAPFRFTVIARSAQNSIGQITNLALVTIFEATGLAGDVLSGVAAVEGTTDQDFKAGDTFAVLLTAGQIAAIQQALAVAGGLAIGSAIGNGPVAGELLYVGPTGALAQAQLGSLSAPTEPPRLADYRLRLLARRGPEKTVGSLEANSVGDTVNGWRDVSARGTGKGTTTLTLLTLTGVGLPLPSLRADYAGFPYGVRFNPDAASGSYIANSNDLLIAGATQFTLAFVLGGGMRGASSFVFSCGSGDYLTLFTQGGNTSLWMTTGGNINASFSNPTDEPQTLVYVFDGSQPDNASRLKCFFCGVEQTLTFFGTVPASVATQANSIGIGSANQAPTNPNFWYDGTLFEVLYSPQVFSSQDLAGLDAYFRVAYFTPAGVTAIRQYIYMGDSLTLGYPTAAFTGADYPTQVASAAGVSVRKHNFGVVGNTTTQMLARQNQSFVILQPYCAKRLYFLWAGANDPGIGTGDPTTTFNNLLSLATAAKNTGCEVVILTMLPRGDVASPTQFDIDRMAVNSAIISQVSPPWSAIGDVGADPLLGVGPNSGVASYLDETYYQADKVHLTDAGYARVATLVNSAITGL